MNSVWFVFLFCTVLAVHLADRSNVIIKVIMRKKETVVQIIANSEFVRCHCIVICQSAFLKLPSLQVIYFPCCFHQTCTVPSHFIWVDGRKACDLFHHPTVFLFPFLARSFLSCWCSPTLIAVIITGRLDNIIHFLKYSVNLSILKIFWDLDDE